MAGQADDDFPTTMGHAMHAGLEALRTAPDAARTASDALARAAFEGVQQDIRAYLRTGDKSWLELAQAQISAELDRGAAPGPGAKTLDGIITAVCAKHPGTAWGHSHRQAMREVAEAFAQQSATPPTNPTE